MHPFSLRIPTDIADAVQYAREQTAPRFIAGGTTLIDLMKLGIERPSILVDIAGLADLDFVGATTEGGLRIGALAAMSDVADNPVVQAKYPMIAQALNKGASAQLRNMATIGGNLLQRTRCPYFRDVVARCNKRDPGAGCDAIEGVNRETALLDVSEHCIALHPSDLCVALVALDTLVETLGPRGQRLIPFEQLHRAPGDTPEVEHDLQPGELITAVRVGASKAAAHSAYLKIRDRESYQFAVVSVAAALELDATGIVRQARIGLGGVSTRPRRAREAERHLEGRALSEEVAMEAGGIAMAGAHPRRNNAFKIELMANTLATAVMSLELSHTSSDAESLS